VKRLLACLAVLVLAVTISSAGPARAADCLYGEWPDGGCKPAPGATPTPAPTPRPSTSATPRPSALTLVSNICDHGANYGHDIITIRATYPTATEVWVNSDFGIPTKVGSGTGTYTVTLVYDPSFNKADVKLTAPGVTWYWYGDEPQAYASLVVHYVACP
jgi:hypothetical protein